MEENKIYCSHCGTLIEDDDYEEVNGQIVCTDCYENHTTTCDRCGSVIWTDDSYGDEYTTLCSNCYHNHYTRCSCCDSLLHEDDAYHLDGYDYCSDCYHEEVDKNRSIHDYGYKPEPIFYGDSHRYFGVELEIDGAGKDSDNADEILAIANKDEEHIYIKGDGSLDDEMELVTPPMTLSYHKQYCWEEIMKKAIYLGYRSHQTSTCGLHVHDGKVAIYKRPKAAHKIHFNAPDTTKAIMGHTRFATQGDKKKNYNNHPFAGHADKEFAFAHNGVLYNDNTLRRDKKLPDTHIETDSYIAVQLIEQQGKLDFDSLRDMAEAVHGNFTFTVLDQENSLYIIKGSNPMYLLHFQSLGLYVYASTESIMKKALSKTCLGRFNSNKIDCVEGDILCIDSNGEITKEQFEPALYRSHFMSWYDDEPYYNVHEELLLAYCGCYGVDTADIEILLEYGYTCDEIEDMLADHSLLHETLCAIKGEEEYSLLEAF